VHALVGSLGFRDIYLVGHDWGAAVAHAYAAQHRDEVRKLAIFEMVLPGFGLMEGAMMPQPNGNFLWHMGFQSVPHIAEELIRGREAAYLNNMFQFYAYDPSAVAPEHMREYIEAMQHVGALHAGLGYYSDFFVSAEQNRTHSETKLIMPVHRIHAGPGDRPWRLRHHGECRAAGFDENGEHRRHVGRHILFRGHGRETGDSPSRTSRGSRRSRLVSGEPRRRLDHRAVPRRRRRAGAAVTEN
jgi:pimeloyl-ACP methyl ester carboxylesterase